MSELSENLELAAKSILDRRGDYFVEGENALKDVVTFLLANQEHPDYTATLDLVDDASAELESDPLEAVWYFEELARILR